MNTNDLTLKDDFRIINNLESLGETIQKQKSDLLNSEPDTFYYIFVFSGTNSASIQYVNKVSELINYNLIPSFDFNGFRKLSEVGTQTEKLSNEYEDFLLQSKNYSFEETLIGFSSFKRKFRKNHKEVASTFNSLGFEVDAIQESYQRLIESIDVILAFCIMFSGFSVSDVNPIRYKKFLKRWILRLLENRRRVNWEILHWKAQESINLNFNEKIQISFLKIANLLQTIAPNIVSGTFSFLTSFTSGKPPLNSNYILSPNYPQWKIIVQSPNKWEILNYHFINVIPKNI